MQFPPWWWYARSFQNLRRHKFWEMHREPEVPEAEAPVEECLDGIARITLKELAPHHSVKSGTVCSTSPRVDAGVGKCSHAHRQVDEQPSNRSRKNGKVQWLCWKMHDNWVTYLMIWSRRNLRRWLKTVVWKNWPRWSSSAKPQRSKIWVSVSGGDGMVQSEVLVKSKCIGPFWLVSLNSASSESMK